jgi:hypothetical protein
VLRHRSSRRRAAGAPGWQAGVIVAERDAAGWRFDQDRRSARSRIPRSIRRLMTKLTAATGSTSNGAQRRV